MLHSNLSRTENMACFALDVHVRQCCRWIFSFLMTYGVKIAPSLWVSFSRNPELAYFLETYFDTYCWLTSSWRNGLNLSQKCILGIKKRRQEKNFSWPSNLSGGFAPSPPDPLEKKAKNNLKDTKMWKNSPKMLQNFLGLRLPDAPEKINKNAWVTLIVM